MKTLQELMRWPYPSFTTPLQVAVEWLGSGEAQKKKDAIALLRQLRTRFSDSIQVRGELILALLEEGEEAEALEELREVDRRFKDLNEEVRCRFGEFFKEKGIAAWESKQFPVAEARFREAVEQYRRAYNARRGPYPGINTAALLFFLAVVAREMEKNAAGADYLKQSTALAQEVLDNRPRWRSRGPDDNIWFPALQAEAELLLAHWSEAAKWYRTALHEPNVTVFHRGPIGKQARRVLHGWKRLGTQPGPPLDRPDDVLGPA